ncbi:MAG: CapA family protein [Flavobacteriaceae bacterium]|nr:CapA family protein [Flavobacteriaceae bacterium]
MKKPKAAKGVTWVGYLTIPILAAIYRFLGWLHWGKWKFPVRDFEEDPRSMGAHGVIYLGYKYYQNPHNTGSKGFDAETYFAEQDLDFHMPEGFVAINSITLHAGGDLMPYKLINANTAKHLWDEVGKDFFGADIVTANLETPIVTSKKQQAVPEMMLYHMYFNGSEEMFNIFNGNGNYSGFDVLSVANNHSLDMGETGLADTLAFLDEKKIAHCGAALTETDLHSFPILERNGIRTAFLSYTYSLNREINPKHKPWLTNHLPLNTPGCDLTLLKEQCRLAKERGAAFTAISLHCGNAYQAYPSSHIVDLFHRVFDECGPDIILGSHPHNIQPMETYTFADQSTGRQKKGFAIYSLGDFVAYDIFTWGHLPVYLKLKLSIGLLNGQPYSQLEQVEAVPLYASFDKEKMELRFKHLTEALSKVENLPRRNQNELKGLAHFYQKHFVGNLNATS